MEDGGRLERGGERAWEWEMENRMARKYRLEEGIGVTLYVEVMKIEVEYSERKILFGSKKLMIRIR